MNAKEALDRAIAAAEQAQQTADKTGTFHGEYVRTYTLLAQAWAAIARETRAQEAWEIERYPLREASWTYHGVVGVPGVNEGLEDEGEGRLDGVPLALQVTDEGDDGDDRLLCQACEEGHSQASVLQDDLAQALRLLGLGDHARPKSPHQVFVDEVLPAIRKLVGDGGDHIQPVTLEEAFINQDADLRELEQRFADGGDHD